MSKRSKKNLVVALAALTSGTIGAAAIASHVAIYDKMFPRYDRPDYSLGQRKRLSRACRRADEQRAVSDVYGILLIGGKSHRSVPPLVFNCHRAGALYRAEFAGLLRGCSCGVA